MRVVFITIFLTFLFVTSKINVLSNYYNYYSMEFYYLREMNKVVPVFRTAEEWSLDVARDYPKSKYIDQILDGISIEPTDSSRMIVYKISRYIATQLDRYRNSQITIDAHAYSLEELLKMIQSGQTGVYCTHYSKILAEMASQAGLPTRIIHTGSVGDTYNHTLVEVFLIDENQWAVADLQNGYALIVDKITHQPLNLHELISTVKSGNSFDVVSSSADYLTYQPSSVSDGYVEYYGGKNSLLYEVRPNFALEWKVFNWWQHCGIYCKVAEY